MRRGAAAAAMVLAFALVVAVVATAWSIGHEAASGVAVERYVLLDDGVARLLRHDTESGTRWESAAVEVLPGFRAVTELNRSLADGVAGHVIGEGSSTGDALQNRAAFADARVAQVIRRMIEPDGSTATTTDVQVLDERGLFLVGFSTGGGDGAVTVFEPALPLLPASMRTGTSWEGAGRYGSSTYDMRGRVTGHAAMDTPAGRNRDCVSVDATLELQPEDQDVVTITYTDSYCAGYGALSGISTGPATSDEYRVVTTVGGPPVDPGLKTARDIDPGAPSTWELSRVGSVLPLQSTGGATFAPVYLPTDPPTVVAGTDAGGDIVALRAGGVSGAVEWRLPTGGAVFGSPRYDAERGRLYLGASDGLVRAVDRRGLFLWSAATGDNVATQPALVGDVVVAASEDGYVYGFDAATGRRVWRTQLTGAAASSPAVVDGLVVIGDDGGTVTALDPTDGDVAWSHLAGDAIEAALVTVGDDVLVADRSGVLTRHRGRDGSVVWDADVGLGGALRWAPTVVGDVTVVVDDFGEVRAVDTDTGETRWDRDGNHRGAPATFGDHVVVVTRDGVVEVLDDDGELVRAFEVSDAGFEHGPTVGGDALWLADDTGAVRRLGPGGGAVTALRPKWFKTIVDEPFASASMPIAHTPVAWSGGLAVVDVLGHLFQVDPETGEGTRVADLARDTDQLIGEPQIVDGVLVVDLKDRVAAFDPATGAERWSRDVSEGDRFRPLAIADGIVVVVVPDGDGARIDALALDDGSVRWSMPTGAAALQSGPIAADHVVYAGAPVLALAIADGAVQWTSMVTEPIGGPALHEGAGVLVVAGISDDETTGRLEAIDLRTGETAWSRSTGADAAVAFHGLLATEDDVVVPSLTGALVAVDPGTGDDAWRIDLPAPILGNPAVIDGHVWVAMETGQVVALDERGRVSSSFEGLGTSIGAIGLTQRPVGSGDLVVVVAGNLVLAVGAGE